MSVCGGGSYCGSGRGVVGCGGVRVGKVSQGQVACRREKIIAVLILGAGAWSKMVGRVLVWFVYGWAGGLTFRGSIGCCANVNSMKLGG